MLPPSLNESVRQERSGVLQVKPYERCVGGACSLPMASMFNSFTALAFVEGLRVEGSDADADLGGWRVRRGRCGRKVQQLSRTNGFSCHLLGKLL